MKKLLFVILIYNANFLHAQDSTRVRVISADSLQKYHIGIAKTGSSAIHLVKTTEKPWSQMNILEKGIFLIKSVFKSNPIMAWSLTILLGVWLLSQVYKLFNR